MNEQKQAESLPPPIGEVALSLQFSPVVELHSGLVWDFFRTNLDGWQFAAEADPIDDHFESAGVVTAAPNISLSRIIYPGRIVVSSPSKDKLCQLQKTRLVYNWRAGHGSYPKFSTIAEEFFDIVAKFKNFVNAHSPLGLRPNQWELVYVDFFPRGRDWQRLEDWSNVLPGLFSKLAVENPLVLASRNASWSFDLPDNQGRLHISANYGANQSDELLILNSTMRGGLSDWSLETIKSKLNNAHEILVNSFKNCIAQHILERCR